MAKVLGVVVLMAGVGLVTFLVYGSRKHGLAAHYRTGALAPIATQPFNQNVSQKIQQPAPMAATPAPLVVQPTKQDTSEDTSITSSQ